MKQPIARPPGRLAAYYVACPGCGMWIGQDRTRGTIALHMEKGAPCVAVGQPWPGAIG